MEQLRFASTYTKDAGDFKLLELPQDLATSLEGSTEALSFNIKGSPGEDAVLCTRDKTYSLRSVLLSNSLLVVTPDPEEEENPIGIVIRDQVNEILELAPIVPKLHKLASLLKGRGYNGEEEGQDIGDSITYKDLQDKVQASDVELRQGLRQQHILDADGQMRPIASDYLESMLKLLLDLAVSVSGTKDSIQVEPIISTLANDHEIPRKISVQVMSWFGDLAAGFWKVDELGIVKQLGLFILQKHKHDSIREDRLMQDWKQAVGDAFEQRVSLSLLSGNFISAVAPAEDDHIRRFLYFPASGLPVEPALRFQDLFLTKSKWKAEEIAPFLDDIALNAKDRDKLLLKYGRAITDPQGVWYTARVQYHG